MASAACSGAAEAVMAAVAVLSLAAAGSAQLQQGFYKGKCNGTDVEVVVRGIVKSSFAREPPIVRPDADQMQLLKRLQLKDCT